MGHLVPERYGCDQQGRHAVVHGVERINEHARLSP
jgi:hypothetical protein